MLFYTVCMHEWALAEAVIETVRKEIGSRNIVSVDSVVLSCGELQNIDLQVLKQGLAEMIPEDIPMDPKAVVLKTEPAGFVCGVCGREWGFADVPELTEEDREAIHFLPESAHTFLACPDCGSPDFTVSRGRGILVESIGLLEEKGRE